MATAATTTTTTACVALAVRDRLFAGHDIDEEIKHVGFREGSGDIGSLEGAAFVFFGVDPSSHSQFGDEDVASLGEEDGRLG